MFVTVVSALVMASVHALKDEEVALFYNDAALTQAPAPNNDTYSFTAVGLPEHEIDNSINPNGASQQNYEWEIMVTPEDLDTPGCLTLGVIGFAVNGVAFFNPYSAQGLNAVEGEGAESFDQCNGHADMQGRYHYHMRPSCLVETLFNDSQTEVFIGVALDGYAIYTTSSGDQSGLDDCNGKMVDGVYRYYATNDFPYVLGCYKGKVVDDASVMINVGMVSPSGGGRMPPPNAGGGMPPPNGGGGMGPPNTDGDMVIPCYYADVENPSSFDDVQAGTLNNEDSGATNDTGAAAPLFHFLQIILTSLVVGGVLTL